MTKKEHEEFKKWNIEITRNEFEKDEVARKIESKYLTLNKKRSCNPEWFILEIAKTEGVSDEEKVKDIRDYILHIEASAKARALSDILHIYK